MISAPDPGVVDNRVVGIDTYADGGLANRSAADAEDDIAQHDGVGGMAGSVAIGADFEQYG